MLNKAKTMAMVPIKDLARARKFYEETLGLKVVKEMGEMAVGFEAGHGTTLLIFPPNDQTTPTHTVATFIVDDVTKTVKQLADRGVTFKDYTEGPLRTNEHHVAKMGSDEAAWFQDSEGNILGLSNDI